MREDGKRKERRGEERRGEERRGERRGEESGRRGMRSEKKNRVKKINKNKRKTRGGKRIKVPGRRERRKLDR